MSKVIVSAVFLFLFSFHLMFFESDPSPIKRWGDVGDEGYWVHNARVNILFKNYNLDDVQMSRFG